MACCREVAGGLIENVYRLQIINTSDSPLRLRLSAEGLPGLAVLAGQEASDVVEVEAAANKLVPMVIRVPAGGKPGAHPITLHARAQDGENRGIETDEPASFYIPTERGMDPRKDQRTRYDYRHDRQALVP